MPTSTRCGPPVLRPITPEADPVRCCDAVIVTVAVGPANTYTVALPTIDWIAPENVTVAAIPLGPAGPAGPAAPVAPIEPVAPCGPVGPCAPCGPVGPAAPVPPVAPIDPGGPARPGPPSGPIPP